MRSGQALVEIGSCVGERGADVALEVLGAFVEGEASNAGRRRILDGVVEAP